MWHLRQYVMAPEICSSRGLAVYSMTQQRITTYHHTKSEAIVMEYSTVYVGMDVHKDTFSVCCVTIHGVKCLVLQSHDLHAGRLQQSPSSYQDDHERCAAFRPARLHFLRLFYLTLTRSRGTAPLPLPDSHPSAVSMHSSRSIHSSCMSPRSSAVLRSTAHTQRFQTDRIPSSCSLRL